MPFFWSTCLLFALVLALTLSRASDDGDFPPFEEEVRKPIKPKIERLVDAEPSFIPGQSECTI
jgi:hypothetical protein